MTRLIADSMQDGIATAGFEVSTDPAALISAGIAVAANAAVVLLFALLTVAAQA